MPEENLSFWFEAVQGDGDFQSKEADGPREELGRTLIPPFRMPYQDNVSDADTNSKYGAPLFRDPSVLNMAPAADEVKAC